MPTYCTAQNIASMLQILQPDNVTGDNVRLVFSVNTNPTLDEVNELIEDVEDDIDRRINTTYKAKTKTNEYHDFHSFFHSGRYRDISNIPIFTIDVKEKPLREMLLASDHKIEIWNNDEWENILETGEEGDAMYHKDFFIDYQSSKIHLFNKFPSKIGQKMIRITYAYGHVNIPGNVKLVAKLMAGAYYIERFEMYEQGDKEGSPASTMAEKWLERAEKKLERMVEREIEVL
jgi:hypothetical protein